MPNPKSSGEEYKKYTDIAGPAIIASGAKILSRGGKIINLEGQKFERIVIIEFPSMNHAEKFYISNEYRNGDIRHCYADITKAKKLLDLNCYISVSGIITFKKSDELAATISSIPMENLLVETDSPYLAPKPHRGKDNEPSYIIHTVKKLSEIKKLSSESIIFNTTNNFMKLFNLS